jgi:two-component system LytT family response regulator
MTAAPDTASLRVLIVDDEPLGREALRLALSSAHGVEVVGESQGGAQAIDTIREQRPDIVLLDIRMPEVDGFDVLRALGTGHRPVVIFVTASDSHAKRAFDVHALDYVLKPFDDTRVHTAIERARWALQARRLQAAAGEMQALLERMGAPRREDPADRIAVRRDGGLYFVRTDDIDYIEAAGNYAKLHAGAEVHVVRATMRSLLARLDQRRFCRIHKSIIVNVDHVREVNPWMGGDYVVIMRDNLQLRASRTHVPDLMRPFR